MSKMKIMSLLLGAALFTGMGTSALSAKCGAGKCGSDMKKEASKSDKCGAGKCGAGKCGSDMKKDAKKSAKCGAGKCGSDMKKDAKKSAKCGAGKCGSK